MANSPTEFDALRTFGTINDGEAMTKENQHTVSKFYLKGFLRPGEKFLRCYPTDGGRDNRVSPKKATVESHFYSFLTEEGDWDDSLEDRLETVETMSAPVVKRLAAGIRPSPEDRFLSSFFIALTMQRVVPAVNAVDTHKGTFESVEVVERCVDRERERLEQQFSAAQIEDFLQTSRELGVGVSLGEKFPLHGLLLRAWNLAEQIASMKWAVATVPSGAEFVTSDAPVVCRNSKNLLDQSYVPFGRRDLNAELTFPLNQTAMLIADWQSRKLFRVKRVESPEVDSLNTRTVLGADRFVFASTRRDSIRKLISQFGSQKIDAPPVPTLFPEMLASHHD
ncbi:MAG: DUF4238 domain-containing protein [Planctomycetaceae bacterium]